MQSPGAHRPAIVVFSGEDKMALSLQGKFASVLRFYDALPAGNTASRRAARPPHNHLT
jgi:hypothetical protein